MKIFSEVQNAGGTRIAECLFFGGRVSGRGQKKGQPNGWPSNHVFLQCLPAEKFPGGAHEIVGCETVKFIQVFSDIGGLTELALDAKRFYLVGNTG